MLRVYLQKLEIGTAVILRPDLTRPDEASTRIRPEPDCSFLYDSYEPNPDLNSTRTWPWPDRVFLSRILALDNTIRTKAKVSL